MDLAPIFQADTTPALQSAVAAASGTCTQAGYTFSFAADHPTTRHLYDLFLEKVTLIQCDEGRCARAMPSSTEGSLHAHLPPDLRFACTGTEHGETSCLVSLGKGHSYNTLWRQRDISKLPVDSTEPMTALRQLAEGQSPTQVQPFFQCSVPLSTPFTSIPSCSGTTLSKLTLSTPDGMDSKIAEASPLHASLFETGQTTPVVTFNTYGGAGRLSAEASRPSSMATCVADLAEKVLNRQCEVHGDRVDCPAPSSIWGSILAGVAGIGAVTAIVVAKVVLLKAQDQMVRRQSVTSPV